MTNKAAVLLKNIDTAKLSVNHSLAGKNVLVTGTTGFVGKVIIEKLLRDIPDIGGVYLLIRGNKSYPDAHDRFSHEIACSSIFDRLKANGEQGFQQLCSQKIHCITGEVTESRFGLEDEQFKYLAKKIDVIVNSAASVNFREELDQALSINALCLYNTVAFSKSAGQIPVLQVSTCYVNGFNKGAMHEENVRPLSEQIPLNADGYYELDTLLDDLQGKISQLKTRYSGENLKNKLVDLGISESNRYGWNDTYTFTKWMGEQILRKELKGSSLTILRPAIVESALIEPSPGWIEGVKVADAILMAYAREKVVFFPGNPNGIVDIIPVDLVANSIIIGVAELLRNQLKKQSKHRVYQCCSGGSNPVKIRELIKFTQQEADKNHLKHNRLFYRKPKRPFIMVSKKVFIAMMNAVKFPLMGINKISKLFGSDAQGQMLENLDTAMKLSTVFSFYTQPEYVFHNNKLMELHDRLSEADRALFPIDATLIDWEEYIRNIHIPGLNKYALKERKRPEQKSEQVQKKAKAA
jgi:alcohol-forming fatty acyl-CoA reductase